MKRKHPLIAAGLGAFGVLALALNASAATNLVTNGDFETGDTSSWVYFGTAGSTFTTTGDAFAGSFAGELANPTITSSAVIKQTVGAGVVNAFDTVLITFFAKGLDAAGGVQFAELFSEGASGVSKSEILGGAPLFAGAAYAPYSFETTLGADVTNGVTLQFAASTGGAEGSTSTLFLDDVSLTVIPEPSSLMLLASGVGVFAFRRRKP